MELFDDLGRHFLVSMPSRESYYTDEGANSLDRRRSYHIGDGPSALNTRYKPPTLSLSD